MRLMKQGLVLLLLVSLASFSNVSYADTAEFGTFRQNFATVIFTGLGGAVLGLSTLSFYGEPQEHIGNIWTGLALGIIGGTAYVVQKATDVKNTPAVMGDPFVPPSNPNKVTSRVPSILNYQFTF